MSRRNEWAKEFERKEAERKENPGTAYFRSYYKGYGLREQPSGDGLVRNEFVYSGMLYCFQGEHKKFVLLKAAQTVILLASIGCLVLCGMQSGSVNASRIFAAPFFAAVLLLVLRIFVHIFYLLSPVRMREWDYVRGIKRGRIFSAAAGITGAIGAVICLVLGIVLADMSAATILSIACFAGFAVFSIASYIIERKQNYRQLPA